MRELRDAGLQVRGTQVSILLRRAIVVPCRRDCVRGPMPRVGNVKGRKFNRFE